MPVTHRPTPFLLAKKKILLPVVVQQSHAGLTEAGSQKQTREFEEEQGRSWQGRFQKYPVVTSQTSLAISTFPARWRKHSHLPETIDSFLGIVKLHS